MTCRWCGASAHAGACQRDSGQESPAEVCGASNNPDYPGVRCALPAEHDSDHRSSLGVTYCTWSDPDPLATTANSLQQRAEGPAEVCTDPQHVANPQHHYCQQRAQSEVADHIAILDGPPLRCKHEQIDDGGECYACGWVLPIEELTQRPEPDQAACDCRLKVETVCDICQGWDGSAIDQRTQRAQPDQPDTAGPTWDVVHLRVALAQMLEDRNAARAQVAALTAERNRALILRDKYFVRSAVHLQRAEKAEAHLAAVRALCDDADSIGAYAVLLIKLREALGGDQ